MNARRLLVATALAIAPFAVSTTLLAQGSTTTASSASVSASTPAPKKFDVKVAVVDFDRALHENEDGLRAKAVLSKFRDRRQRYISDVELRLKDQEDELRALFQADDPNAQRKALLLERDVAAYNELITRVNTEISARDQELSKPINDKLHDVIKKIGEAEGYDLVVDKKALPFSPSTVDLTDRVIKEYNWGSPKPASSASAAASASASSPPKTAPTAPAIPAY